LAPPRSSITCTAQPAYHKKKAHHITSHHITSHHITSQRTSEALPESFLRKSNPHLKRKRLNHKADRRGVRIILPNSKRTARIRNLPVNQRGFFGNRTVSRRMVFLTPSRRSNLASNPRSRSSSLLLTLQRSSTQGSTHIILRRFHFVRSLSMSGHYNQDKIEKAFQFYHIHTSKRPIMKFFTKTKTKTKT
jgi:hypothetical protein